MCASCAGLWSLLEKYFLLTLLSLGTVDYMTDSCTTVGAAKGLYAASPDVTITFK